MLKLRDVQCLRALAALLVVLDHAVGLTVGHGIAAEPWNTLALFAGAQGVAIFFIISGFIMTYTAEPDSRDKAGARAKRFALRRIIRVVPLYWVFTALIAVPALVLKLYRPVSVTGAMVAKSFFFIPYVDGGGNMTPVLPIGWTLNYEMLFYAVFTVLLFLPGRVRTAGLLLALGTAVLVGTQWYPVLAGGNPHSVGEFVTNPVVLLFGAGAALGWLKLRLPQIQMRLPGLLVVAPLLALNLSVFAMGIRCLPVPLACSGLFWTVDLLAVAACVFGVSKERPWLEAVGDASYSLYLIHLIPVFLGYAVWQRMHYVAPVVFLLVSLMTATVAGLLCYRWLERPLTKKVSTLLLPDRRLARAAGLDMAANGLPQPCTPPANPL